MEKIGNSINLRPFKYIYRSKNRIEIFNLLDSSNEL